MTSVGKALDFLPLILGTDNNAYGVARAIYENYGIKSVCLGKRGLGYTSDSKILTRVLNLRMGEDKVLLDTLEQLSVRYPEVKKIIIPCGDSYAQQVSRNKQLLESRGFLFSAVDAGLQKRLENKLDFYSVCEQYGLAYPKTFVITEKMVSAGDVQLPFDFPVALKANDSIAYLGLNFAGKRKAYRIENSGELNDALHRIYAAGYTGKMVAQDFIPGDCAQMAVLNAYVSRSGQVRMMCFGQCVLDAVLPAEIGNYHALYTTDGSEVYPVFQRFLEEIGYTGFVNFDLKRDPRDGVYKVFEINLRQGRSSFHMDLGGCNFITYLIDDLLGLDDGSKPAHLHTETGKMWLYVSPFLVKRYAPPAIRQQALEVLRRGYGFTQWYEKDRTWLRWLRYHRERLSSLKSYWHYARRPGRA
ncbi:carboxylate--amine ligase [Mobiluncus mulieris]|uniref:carboxylate--amine ligase n=1 Tax=Mobiluncus mulieris TaxID=2052 RepID=UPI00146FDDD1|nr:carboxylate--amine ligase [Mobiluncus mulieris]